MSFTAVQWALSQDAGRSATKFVLVAMANHVNAESGEWVCWPSYAAIGSVTLQDVKTVEAAVSRLKELRFIVDTGMRRGETGKVIVYRLNDPNSGVISPGLQNASANGTRPQNDPGNGVIGQIGNPPKFPANPPKFPDQSPQISGPIPPKTGGGIRNGTGKGTRKEPIGAAAAAQLLPDVSAPLLADWLKVRKDKHAGPVTQTVVDGLTREAGKANLSRADAVRYCCEAGWQNFNAGYHAKREGLTPFKPHSKPSRHSGFQTVNYEEGLTNGVPDA